MSARVSTGSESRQDYGTPAAFLDAVEHRFGPVAFDLAAHAANHKAEKYFAPRELTATIIDGATFRGPVIGELERQGADFNEVARAIDAIDWSRVYFLNRVLTDPAFRAAVLALRGKRLGCPGCATGAPCHARLIADWIEAQPRGGA